jgi:class 3 adenylate cyclase
MPATCDQVVPGESAGAADKVRAYRAPRAGIRPAASSAACRFCLVEPRRVVLLIADIGGYTSYMQSHRSMLGHAEAATTRLLKKVVAAAQGFDLVEVEGDAAFLSREVGASGDAAALASVSSAAVAMHRAFHEERRLVERNLCPCESCTQTSELKLKFVAHVGEVATQTIKRRRKLVGMDVIYVHRLLKNAVPVPEYVLLSEDLYRGGSAAAPAYEAREITQDLEGIGPVSTFFVEVSELAGPVAPVPDPSALRRLGVTLGMVGRGLPYALRVRRPPPVVAP